MRTVRRMGAAALCWLMLLVAAATVVVWSQDRTENAQLTRFEARAAAAASIVAAYTQDVFDRERRIADWLPSRAPSDAAFSREVFEAGFSGAALLDASGRLLSSAPIGASSPVNGTGATSGYLSEAFTGRAVVSDALATGPASANFALPLQGGSGRVLTVALDLREGPLQSFVSASPVPGSRGFLVDSRGTPLIMGGDGTGAQLDGFDVAAALSEPVHREDRVAVAAPVPGTPWRLMLTAPEDAVSPSPGTNAVAWWLLGGIAVATLAGGLLFGWIWASRRRSRTAQAELAQQFRLTVENAPIGICLVGLNGEFLHTNVQLQRMLGYTAEELRASRSVTSPIPTTWRPASPCSISLSPVRFLLPDG